MVGLLISYLHSINAMRGVPAGPLCSAAMEIASPSVRLKSSGRHVRYCQEGLASCKGLSVEGISTLGCEPLMPTQIRCVWTGAEKLQEWASGKQSMQGSKPGVIYPQSYCRGLDPSPWEIKAHSSDSNSLKAGSWVPKLFQFWLLSLEFLLLCFLQLRLAEWKPQSSAVP